MYKTAKGFISAILAAAVAATPMFGSYTNAESSENAASKIDTASEAVSSVLSEKDIPECLALEASKLFIRCRKAFNAFSGIDEPFFYEFGLYDNIGKSYC